MTKMWSRKWIVRILLFFTAVIAFLVLALAHTGAQAAASKIIYFYYGQGCPHCAKVEQFFQRGGFYTKYHIESREIYFNRTNAAEFNQALNDLNVPESERGVPTVIAGQKYLTGDSNIINNFVSFADAYVKGSGEGATVKPAPKQNKLNIFTVAGASLVDAVNPCAFAVMILLLTAVLASSKSVRKVVMAGLSFTLAVFLSYISMGLGLYAALGTAGSTTLITHAVGILAIVLGLLNLKDYFWYGKVTLIEVPRSWRPAMKGLISRVTSAPGAFAVGLLVSLFLLPCTSGPYIVILGLLAQNPLDAGAIAYLILYNVIFILPMLLITFLVAKGVAPERLESIRQRHLRELHLAAGLLLLGLGVFVLV